MCDKMFKEKAAEICGRLSLDDKISLLCVIQRAIPDEKLQEFTVGAEVARGYVGRKEEHYSTVFPQPIGLAGTFDTELMAELGEIAGNEGRAYANCDTSISPCLWGPTVDMERNPLWGRTEEGYGEDVCLAGYMSAAYTKAMAADNGKYVKSIPTLKHFAANNNEADRGKCNAVIPLRLKYEYYYAAFMYAVKYGGAKSIMTAYNEINGIPAMCLPETDSLLKKDWGIWFAVTDGCDFSQTLTAHKYCDSHAEALAESIKSGCDILNDSVSVIQQAAKKALEDKLITMAELDNAVCNVIFSRLKLGQLAEDCEYNNISMDILNDKKSEEVNLRAAREQIVLLKNDGILPLKADNRKIAVVGELCNENFRDWYTGYFRNAVSAVEGIRREFPESEIFADDLWDIVAIKNSQGKYLTVHEDGTLYADGDSADNSALFRFRKWGEKCCNLFSEKYGRYAAYKDATLKLSGDSIYSWFTAETLNFRNISGNDYIIEDFLLHRRVTCNEKGRLTLERDVPILPENTFTLEIISSGLERGKALAQKCDTVIYCAGNDPVQDVKECYDRKTLALACEDDILEIYKINPNTILSIISSFPYAVNRANELLPAIVYSTHAGRHLGTALGETLNGKNIPAGRLALTWYRSELDLPDIMDYHIENSGSTYMYFKGKPLYPFGYGLSYGKFRYKGIEISAKENGCFTAFVTVENISAYDCDEVIQLYYSVEKSKVSRPIKKLCSFKRINIKAHSEVRAELEILPEILQIYDVRREKFITETALYKFMAGGNSLNLPIYTEVEIVGDSLGIRRDTFAAYTFDGSCDVIPHWSKKLKREFIHVEKWSGTAVYGGIDFTGKSAVRLRASSVFDDRKVFLDVDNRRYFCDITATTALDDFREYVIPVEAEGIDCVTVTMSGGMGLLDISII